MKPFRFYIASTSARGIKWILPKFGYNATHFPGKVALKLCPNFLKYLEKPKILIGVTGTNGKTTVVNMIGDILKSKNIKYSSNALGSNIVEGVVTTLLSSTTFNGKNKMELGVFEIDERASIKMFPYLKPDFLVITNLFRDSYRRNAHSEYISNLLTQYIPSTTKLIVNAEDIISSRVSPDNERVSFSLKRQEFEEDNRYSIIKDVTFCPCCDTKIEYDFVRYNHIGFLHCPNCGFTNINSDYIVEKIDYSNNTITINEHNKDFEYKLIGENITDAYNMISSIAACREIGLSHNDLQTAFERMEIVTTRFEEKSFKSKKVVRLLAKGQNPVGTTRVLDYIRKQLPMWGKTVVVFNHEDLHTEDNRTEIENFAWLYDADFEYINQPDIIQIILVGFRTTDYVLRLATAGIDPTIIYSKRDSKETYNIIKYNELDTIVILYDTTNIEESKTMQDMYIDKIKEVTK